MGLPAGKNPIRLNLGAGRRQFPGYLSVDIGGVAGAPPPDIKADVRKIPLEPGTVDEIVAIHLFEHLPRWECESTLAHWHALLKPGGLLVLELPDLVKCCENILKGMDERAGLWGLYGDPGYMTEPMCHRWGWSAVTLSQALTAAGFKKIKVKPPIFHKKYRDMRLESYK